jgi:hypothetical protein
MVDYPYLLSPKTLLVGIAHPARFIVSSLPAVSTWTDVIELDENRL